MHSRGAGTLDNYAEGRLSDSMRDRQKLADVHAQREQQQPAAISCKTSEEPFPR